MTSMAIGFSFWVLGFTIDAIDAIDYKIFFPPPVIDYKILIDVIKSVIDVPFIAVDAGITKSSGRFRGLGIPSTVSVKRYLPISSTS